MKCITSCEKNKEYVIKRLHTTGLLRQRLISFGFIKGVKIQYLQSTSLNKTHEIKVGATSIALRNSEANKIEVESIE